MNRIDRWPVQIEGFAAANPHIDSNETDRPYGPAQICTAENAEQRRESWINLSKHGDDGIERMVNSL